MVIAGYGATINGDEVGPSFSHQAKTEVKEHQGPQHNTDEAGEASVAVSFVDDWESNAEVAPHGQSGEEQTAAVQWGEDEEAEEGAEGWWQLPVLKQNLHSLDGQPNHKRQVSHAQVEGIDHIGCTAVLPGLTNVHKQNQQVGWKSEQKGEGVDCESNKIHHQDPHLFSLGHGHCWKAKEVQQTGRTWRI